LDDGHVHHLQSDIFELDPQNPPYQQQQQQQHDDDDDPASLAICSPRDLRNIECHIGGIRVEAVFGRFYAHRCERGIWGAYSNGSRVLSPIFSSMMVNIGPFTSEAECLAFEPNNATSSQTNCNGVPLSVYFSHVHFILYAIGGMIDDLEQRQAHAAAGLNPPMLRRAYESEFFQCKSSFGKN
jgi:hypothetical protein